MKIRDRLIPLTLVPLLFVLTAYGQHDHRGGYAPALDFSALPPPPLMENIGTARLKITTRSAETQRYFDQGLNLLHAFWDMEAYRAFREASRHDENSAMPYWGIYVALGQNSQEMADERKAALEKVRELLPTVTDHERYYLRAILLLAEPGKGKAAWMSEMEALIDRYPEDVEAKLFLANSLSTPPSSYTPEGRPREGKLYGQMILRNLLVTHPDHLAVHHYWIHAVENGPRPEEALASCEKLEKAAPNSGHLLHMPGHVYYRLGMYDRARAAFLRSLEFDLKYMKEQKIHPINNWNYTHNLDYLVANSAEQGRYREAAKYARMLAEVPSDEERLKATGLGYLLYGGYTALTRLQMRYGFWDEAVKDLEADRTVGAPETLSGRYRAGILSYLKGMGAVEKGDAAAAKASAEELERLITGLADEKPKQASDWYFGFASRILGVHLLDLRGSVLSLGGRHEEAVRLLEEAVSKERELGYWEPPHYTRPVLESLGAAHLRAGKLKEAEETYGRILELRPNSGFAYLGMARANAGNRERAKEFYGRLLEVWSGADKDLPQFREALERTR